MYKQPTSEPIAIIGTSCRFAGQATSASGLWQVLANPPDLSKQVPTDRFDAHAFYHEDGENHGTTNSIKAYWLEQDHRVFDTSFFNITPKEAEAIDPQQRLLLEVVYEAMESSGFTLGSYSGKNVGVFAGVMTADYDTLSQRDELFASQYYATGNARSIISNRISYFFNFRGPSMTIDTACSSSLVALHQAVLSLRSGEIPMACVTGVNLMITPEQFIVESSLHMLSPSGKSRMWDKDADGYARGEGVAAIFLKPLSGALRDGDEILGVIRQTGVNSDGRTPGITMPNPDAQSSLIRSTYSTSGLDPEDPEDRCQYFEAHGTGTQAGDPREAQAIHEAFFGGRIERIDANEKILVGSVKTVIGHTEGAAGLAGILKVLQAMRHGQVPPNLHLDDLNPSVRPFYQHLQIPTKLIAWPQPPPGHPKRASVNSFGFGGTNAHAIVESYVPEIHDATISVHPPLTRTLVQADSTTPGTSLTVTQNEDLALSATILPLLMSATSERSLRRVVRSWRDYLSQNSHVPLERLAWNLYQHRTALPYRLSVTADSSDNAIEILHTMAMGTPGDGNIGTRYDAPSRAPRILGIFTGQGAQWPSMSRSLLLSNTRYRQTIQGLDKVLRQSPDPPSWSLEQQIMAQSSKSRIHEAHISQPLCTALQIGLIDLLESLGVIFGTVIGHSSGEIAAAYAAGRLSARDAILISYYRGLYAHLASGSNGESGAMMAVGMSESEATKFCEAPMFEGRICVAASNAPLSVTLSGDEKMIYLAKEHLDKQSRFARPLLVDTAYHSPHMVRPATAYTEALKRCAISPLPKDNRVQWISSVHESSCDNDKDLSSAYWRDNMIRPVRFFGAVKAALSDSGPFDCAIEVGPHPALKGPVTQTATTITGSPLIYHSLLERSKDDRLAFSEFLGSMWRQLGPNAVDISQYAGQSSNAPTIAVRLTGMPTYQWDHTQTHYRESRLSRQYHFKHAAPHELLGARTRDDNQFDLRWRNILRPDKLPWLAGHSFQSQALVPASAYCVMALEAALQLLDGRSASIVEIRDLEIMSGISMEQDSVGTEALFSLKVLDNATGRGSSGTITASFSLTSCRADGSTSMKKNASGSLLIVLDENTREALPRRQTLMSETLPASTDGFYKMMDDTGLVYTGPFRAIQTIQRRCDFATTTLRRRHPDDSTRLSVSPATLDSCLQSAFLTWSSPGDKSLWTSFLPTRIARVQFNVALCHKLHNPLEHQGMLTVDSHLTNVSGSTQNSKATFTVEVCIYNDDNEMEIEIEGLTVTAFSKTRPEDDQELYLHTVTHVDPADEIVSADEDGPNHVMPSLEETCERIAAFYSLDTKDDARLSINTANTIINPLDHVERSLANSLVWKSLEVIKEVGEKIPCLLPSVLPAVVKEARLRLQYGRHIAKIVEQICHRYPRMNVLSIMDQEADLTECVLEGLGPSYLSLTRIVVSQDERGSSSTRSTTDAKFLQQTIHPGDDLLSQLKSSVRADLVVISISALRTADSQVMLRNVRAAMKNGGYLILVEANGSLLQKKLAGLYRSNVAEENKEDYFDFQKEKDALESCGFRKMTKNADQKSASGLSISVRQANTTPMTATFSPSLATQSQKLLIIGITSEKNQKIGHVLQDRLAEFCNSIELCPSLEAMDSCQDYTSAIILEDLESPIISDMTEKKLSQLKQLLRPKMAVLWLTHQARFANPEHAATLGFTRTISAEVPNLTLQVLDLESIDHCEHVVVAALLNLVAPEPDVVDCLWVREPEIYMEQGRRLVPRVLPIKQLNDRANALRRVVARPVNTVQQVARIVARCPVKGGLEITTSDWAPTQNVQPDTATIKVLYSTAEALMLRTKVACHVCVGQDTTTGELKLALSSTNASYVEVSATSAISMGGYHLIEAQFVHHVTRFLIALAALGGKKRASRQKVIFIDADQSLVHCAKIVAQVESTEFSSWVTNPNDGFDTSGSTRMHKRSSDRQLRTLIPPMGAIIYDFSSDHMFSTRLAKVLPSNYQYYPGSSLLTSQAISCEQGGQQNTAWELGRASALALDDRKSCSRVPSSTLSVNDVVSDHQLPDLINVIDWALDRSSFEIVKPIVEEHLFCDNKTYVLVGLTRDFGQSLSRLFARHGARHIVLASRNPETSPKWKEELLQLYGARITVEKLDVTRLDDVHSFKERIEGHMPAVGGVINGAMVLDDRVFSQMTTETWNRVLRPKTVGSKNLDIVFSDPSLEFFIMTSSFAAIGGHPGQSNYASANMYMNGLAANRRKRGLTGSVLNIGVIYGLGLLQREKEELYIGLEREGYPPISERDIHHMFLEAIVAGRPGASELFDITTGLKRFQWRGANPLHWHLDPRFSHFTVKDGKDDGDESAAGPQRSLLEELSSIEKLDDMVTQVTASFVSHLKTMLRLPDGSISSQSSLSEIGIDSLVAVDIRNWIWKTFARDVAVMKILGAASIQHFCSEIAEQIHADYASDDSSFAADTPSTSRAPSEASAPSSRRSSIATSDQPISMDSRLIE